MAHKSSFLKKKEKTPPKQNKKNKTPNQLLVKHLCNCLRTQLSQYFWSLKLQGFVIRKMLTFKLFPAMLILPYRHSKLAWGSGYSRYKVHRGSSPPLTQTFYSAAAAAKGKRGEPWGLSGFFWMPCQVPSLSGLTFSFIVASRRVNSAPQGFPVAVQPSLAPVTLPLNPCKKRSRSL